MMHREFAARATIQDHTFDPAVHFRLLAIEPQIIGEIVELDSLLTELAKEHDFQTSLVTTLARFTQA